MKMEKIKNDNGGNTVVAGCVEKDGSIREAMLTFRPATLV